MARLYFAIEQGGALVEDFSVLECASLAGDVDVLKQHLKASCSQLDDVELSNMTVYGPWADRMADTARLVGEEPCSSAATIGDLVGDKERAYFIVRVTGPPPAPAAAGGVGAFVLMPCLLAPLNLVYYLVHL